MRHFRFRAISCFGWHGWHKICWFCGFVVTICDSLQSWKTSRTKCPGVRRLPAPLSLLPPSHRKKFRTGSRLTNYDLGYNFPVSASEIIKEVPKLSDAERRAVFDKLGELAQ